MRFNNSSRYATIRRPRKLETDSATGLLIPRIHLRNHKPSGEVDASDILPAAVSIANIQDHCQHCICGHHCLGRRNRHRHQSAVHSSGSILDYGSYSEVSRSTGICARYPRHQCCPRSYDPRYADTHGLAPEKAMAGALSHHASVWTWSIVRLDPTIH
jgi:hypothetical protein